MLMSVHFLICAKSVLASLSDSQTSDRFDVLCIVDLYPYRLFISLLTELNPVWKLNCWCFLQSLRRLRRQAPIMVSWKKITFHLLMHDFLIYFFYFPFGSLSWQYFTCLFLPDFYFVCCVAFFMLPSASVYKAHHAETLSPLIPSCINFV